MSSTTPAHTSLNVMYDSYTAQAFEPNSLTGIIIAFIIASGLIALAFNLIVLAGFTTVVAAFVGLAWFADRMDKADE